jgi:uncharacterized membrane protein
VTTSRKLFLGLAIFSLLGVAFSAVSLYDFIAHLDRQVHAITCSVVPGLGTADSAGTSGCHAALMSPYSAFARSATWGGIPIALPSFAVFAFLLYRALALLLARHTEDASETRFLIAATALPILASVVFFLIAVLKVGALCTVCTGIYVASIGAFFCALLAHRGALRAQPAGSRPAMPWGSYTVYFAEGVALVFLPIVLYLAVKPAYADSFGRCGQLRHPDQKSDVRVALSSAPGALPAVEVLDPLCGACAGFSQRLAASGLEHRLARDLVLFPLDKECNWMVNESLHPGACAVSEAILCGGVKAREVLEWAFAHQSELLAFGGDSKRIYDRIRQRFPQLAECLGKPAVRARLNRSLRWTVANSLPVVTPQLFVNKTKVCEEDTDLGLDFVLSRILDVGQPDASGRPGR